MPRHALVRLLVDAVEDEIHQVETGEKGGGEIDILGNGKVGVISTADRVGRRENARPGVERGDDSSLGHRHGLLLHDFVQDRARGIVHLVKLIDAAHATIGEDEGARLENQLSRFGVARHVRRETDRRGALAASIDTSGGYPVHVCQNL